LITEVCPDREDELARTIKVDPGSPAARPITPPEFVKQEGIEAMVAGMNGKDVYTG
jgi:hypothetical protein